MTRRPSPFEFARQLVRELTLDQPPKSQMAANKVSFAEKKADFDATQRLVAAFFVAFASIEVEAYPLRHRKRFLTLSIWAAGVRGSPVSPSNTAMATGQPSAAHNRP